MTEPAVTIVLPTRNRAALLPGALDSVLAQTRPDWELVLMDDASEDTTPEVVSAYARDPRVVPLRNDRSLGMVGNWEQAFVRARGRYVFFFSDDDRIGPEFLARRLGVLEADPEAAVAFSRIEDRDAAGTLLQLINADQPQARVLEGAELLAWGLSRRWAAGSALYRLDAVRHVWDQVREHELVMDYGLNLRLALAGRWRGHYLPVADFFMTSHPAQNSQARRDAVFHHTDRILAGILEGPLPPAYAAKVRWERASWQVLWGRHRREAGDRAAARAHFLTAVRIDPGSWPAWKQLVKSWAP